MGGLQGDRELFAREQTLHALRWLAQSQPARFKDGLKALADSIDAEIERLNNEKRRKAKDKRALLEIARWAILQENVGGTEHLERVPHKLSLERSMKGVEPHFVQSDSHWPRWMARIFKELGRLDDNLTTTYWNLKEHLEYAQQRGIEHAADKAVDLRTASAVDAYIFSITRRSPDSRKDVREAILHELDPDHATNSMATPHFCLVLLTCALTRESAAAIVTEAEHWRRAAHLLAVLDPDFDTKRTCLARLPTWHQQSKGIADEGRSQVVASVAAITDGPRPTPDDAEHRLWMLARTSGNALSNRYGAAPSPQAITASKLEQSEQLKANFTKTAHIESALVRDEIAILKCLAKTPKSRCLPADLRPVGGPRGLKAIRMHLHALHKKEYVDYPEGTRAGALILPKGLDAIRM